MTRSQRRRSATGSLAAAPPRAIPDTSTGAPLRRVPDVTAGARRPSRGRRPPRPTRSPRTPPPAPSDRAAAPSRWLANVSERGVRTVGFRYTSAASRCWVASESATSATTTADRLERAPPPPPPRRACPDLCSCWGWRPPATTRHRGPRAAAQPGPSHFSVVLPPLPCENESLGATTVLRARVPWTTVRPRGAWEQPPTPRRPEPPRRQTPPRRRRGHLPGPPPAAGSSAWSTRARAPNSTIYALESQQQGRLAVGAARLARW